MKFRLTSIREEIEEISNKSNTDIIGKKIRTTYIAGYPERIKETYCRFKFLFI